MPARALPYPEPTLSDGRYGLRPWAETDLDCVREASADPEIPRGTTVPATFTPDEGRAFIRRQWRRAADGAGVSQAVVDLGADRAIGLVIVSLRPQPGVGGLGYWIVPAARGRGAASAALRLIVPWAFRGLGLRRLEAWVDPDNHPSQQVLLRSGFQLEGRLRNFLTAEGQPSDALVFSAIPPDPQPDRALP
ncbi:GNAT family N-acetyltransferase [Nocardioides antri]|uniref:GNAT family N-acetyltransferase n=1 Tax=Nocardioides antri TaxID=2607659 RepID=A0A5B1LYK8_9ACTN|nr:GNAT family protein [Nocardioides antri]KAA1425584.1 GNAT family N-acetyltransferase [Nocardioides antri]